MKKLLAPLIAITFSLALLITAALNIESSIESHDYFIKTVHPDRVLVVEPNLSRFVKADAIAEDAGESLMNAMYSIAEKYEVTASRIIQVERNIGSVVPNLVVNVRPLPAIEPGELVSISE
ncbi:MAG: hypothetical protein HC895_04795 [Leptolyngbyaceae cyanobacterium SM1_3_5]|nr:hypothetical protein [Leptolyngbyaceae cyanobacterium SM1_3_5]